MIPRLEQLQELKEKLSDWRLFDEPAVLQMVKDFEKIPRDEFSSFYQPVLSDTRLADHVLELGKAYHDNVKILVYTLSALGNMISRYHLKPSDEVFEFFKDAISNKKANYYVSLYLSSFPQFGSWSCKWEYLISIPGIAPRKKSMENFNIEIKRALAKKNEIPADMLVKCIRILETFVKAETISDYSKNEYLETLTHLISELQGPL
jgi:hypothetical protein